MYDFSKHMFINRFYYKTHILVHIIALWIFPSKHSEECKIETFWIKNASPRRQGWGQFIPEYTKLIFPEALNFRGQLWFLSLLVLGQVLIFLLYIVQEAQYVETAMWRETNQPNMELHPFVDIKELRGS